MLLSRFFTVNDPRMERVVLPIPEYWWSRPYEYAWASRFAGGTVLDAACGICHPFKFYLADHCTEVYGCDMDARILSSEDIMQDVREVFGEDGANVIAEGGYLDKVRLSLADLGALPYPDKMFDAIFCISVFEHLPDASKREALRQFHRTLKDEGKLVLTIDYPLADPDYVQKTFGEIGFRLAGPSDFSVPRDAIAGQGLQCYRMILIKDHGASMKGAR
ncbi:MAG: methyltransferase type 11 [Paenibacillus sp.]|jgi:SAM-dependent methyltransferase|nr:methyltransferase type 11 [Paenibacillus sp.]